MKNIRAQLLTISIILIIFVSSSANGQDTIPPAAPQNLTGIPGDSRVTLRWNSNMEPDFLRYYIYQGVVSGEEILIDSSSASILDTMKLITGLTNNVKYYFIVSAIDSTYLESEYSNEAAAVPNAPPAAPQNLIITDSSSRRITLRWSKNSEPDFYRYYIYLGTLSEGESLFDSSAASIEDTVKIFTGLINGKVYYFKVTAKDSAGLESEFSNEVYAFPSLNSSIINVIPDLNELGVDKSSAITVMLHSDIDISTLNDTNITVNASLSGRHTSTFYYDNSAKKLVITPNAMFKTGDLVTVTITKRIKTTIGNPLQNSFSWRFSIKASGGSAQFTLRPTPSVELGGNPWSVTTNDFNGDGSLDLAVVADYSNKLAILKNTGNGTFTVNTQGIGFLPRSIISGNFNKDRIPDLAFSNDYTFTVSNFLNDGKAVFNSNSFNYVQVEPRQLIIDDFDNDGTIDLATANYWSDIATILANDGNGMFWQRSTPYTGSCPYSLTSGDFNNDGSIDLAVANSNESSISILLNDASGIFHQNQKPMVGSMPYSVVTGDFNHDGSLDLASANYFSHSVSILLNDGAGGFSLDTTLDVGLGPCAATVGDFNADQAVDLAIAEAGSNTVSIFLNNGTGSFSLQISPILSETGGFAAYGINTGDFNGDGSLDLAVVGYNSNKVSILFNESNIPNAPSGLTAKGGDEVVHLQWNKNVESDFLCYRIYYDSVSSGTAFIDSSKASDTTKMITNLNNGTTYYFRITALDTMGFESGFSNEVNAVPMKGLGAPDNSITTPFNYALFQNNPNPFNPSTNISFALSSRSQVSLKIYDLTGREVAMLINEELPAGKYTRQWKAGRLASGVYFYRLQAGSFTETRKLVLLR